MSQSHYIIVGAGHAGAMAAVEMRKAGFLGAITLIGDETHLPYERPPLSKDILLGNAPTPPLLHTREALEAAAVRLELGVAVTQIDPAARRLVMADGRSMTFDRLLLATGGAARALPVPGGENAVMLRSLDDALALKARLTPGARVVVIGAGVIGLEVASSAVSIGCAVTVIERAAGPMERSAAPVIQDYVSQMHRGRGVALRYGATLAAIETVGDGSLRVVMKDGSAIAADIVVAGVGLTPNVALARAAGLSIDHAILVDDHGRTSAEGIYAAGDAVSFWHPLHERHLHWQTWQHAQNHGKAVARRMVGAEDKPYAPTPWFWSDQHGINLQFTGYPTEGDETVVRGDPDTHRFAAFHLRDGRVVGGTFINSGGMVRPTQALIASKAVIPAESLADPGIPLPRLIPKG